VARAVSADVDQFTVRPEQWRSWTEHFLPPDEPFFVADADISAALSAAGEVVYTRIELSESFPRFSLDHGYAYHVWSVDADSLVWLADREARDRIDRSLWITIRDEQGRIERGQVYDGHWPLSGIEVPATDRLSDGRWLLAPDTWLALDFDVQRRWLREWMSRRLVDDELRPIDADVAPPYRAIVARYANTFADRSGANCFSATLGMALGRPHDVFPLWLHQEPFLRALRGNGYRRTDAVDPDPGDVVIWTSHTGLPVHAAFCVADA